MVMVRMVHIVLVIMCSIDLQAMHVSEIGGVVARITFRDFLEYWSYISNFPIVRYLADIT